MTFIQIFLTIIVAALVGVLFYYIFKKAGPWGTFWSFLLILILAGVAAAAWIPPVGPIYQDVAWIPVLFVILLFALLLAAATPGRRRGRPPEAPPPEKYGRGAFTAIVALGVFFWLFIFFLFLAAILGVVVSVAA